jgi:hypothetical protein
MVVQYVAAITLPTSRVAEQAVVLKQRIRSIQELRL